MASTSSPQGHSEEPSRRDYQSTQNRYLEMWKVCVDLHIFHDNLKQERAKRFTTVQIALGAGFGWSMSNIPTEVNLVRLFVMSGAALTAAAAGFYYSWMMISLDKRAAEYVRTVKNQIQNVELALERSFPKIQYLPYRGQYLVLVCGTHELSKEGKYAVRKTKPPKTHFAHSRELMILAAVRFGWGSALLGLCVVFSVQFHALWAQPHSPTIPRYRATLSSPVTPTPRRVTAASKK